MSNQVYSTGRRKESIAKVWVSNGTGNSTINKKNIEDYYFLCLNTSFRDNDF